MNYQKDWARKLNDALRVYWTTLLVFGKACHLPVELEHKAYWVMRQLNMDMQIANEKQFL